MTGGTGSFGRKFLHTVFSRYQPKKVIVYSRDELKQFEMQQIWADDGKTPIRYFIGDVRDFNRLRRAMENVDIVIHAAAFKQVPAAEYNPFEAVKTNILGSQNVIDAAMDTGVQHVMALSSDKAVAPINLYGATKLAADKLFIAANNYRGSKDVKFSVVRYGNVMASRGSVIPVFMKHSSKGYLPITDLKVTRFNITLQEAVDFVLTHLAHMAGSEIFVPKIPSYRITDVAKAVAPDAIYKIVGIRPGEKLHEEMITVSDAMNTADFDDYFAIMPTSEHIEWDKNKFLKESNGKPGKYCEEGFKYDSATNKNFLSIDQIRELIIKHVPNGEVLLKSVEI